LSRLYTSVVTFTTLGYGDVYHIGYSRVAPRQTAPTGGASRFGRAI